MDALSNDAISFDVEWPGEVKIEVKHISEGCNLETLVIPSPIRGWDLVLPWFHLHYYYPIPRKGMGSCSSLVSCTLLLLYFTSSSCRSKTRLNFGLVFKISQWNFLGTLAMGPQAHILIYGLTCHAVMELWQKMCKKMDKWMYELWSPMKRWPKFTQTMILGYLG